MANLTETATWEAGINQLERTDLWDAGVAGAGVANLAIKQLANRTKYLHDRISYNLNSAGPHVVATSSSLNMDGTAYALNFPVASPFYTTPNDGVTRNYKITLSCFADFTYNASGNVRMVVYTTTVGPVYVQVMNARLRQPYQHICLQKVISIGPNVPLKVFIENNATGANATFSELSFHIEELLA